MPKHVILVDGTPMLASSGHRGIGRYVYDLLHGLEAVRSEWSTDFDVRAVTSLSLYGGAKVERDLAVGAESLRDRRGSENATIMWKRRLFLASAAEDVDVLHLTEAIGTPLGRVRRCSATCHDLIPLKMPDVYFGGNRLLVAQRRFADQRRYRRCDRLIANSKHTRDDVIEMLAIPREKIEAVTTGIDLSFWSSENQSEDGARLRSLSVGDRPYLLFVGQGDVRKDMPGMFRTLALARRSREMELVWAGEVSAPARERFLALAEQEGVADHVRFLGYTGDAALAALYRGAVALLFLSFLEGFGLPVAEAMASGCPVVVLRGSGCDEVAGEAGFVIAPGAHADAATAVAVLSSDVTERTRRIRTGLGLAARFDRREMARGYIEQWRRMLAASAR